MEHGSNEIVEKKSKDNRIEFCLCNLICSEPEWLSKQQQQQII